MSIPHESQTVFDSAYLIGDGESDWVTRADRMLEIGVFMYQLTKEEEGWLDWIGRRYALGDLLSDDWEAPEKGDGPGLVWINACKVSRALAEDGVDRAPCLDEDTGLAKLIWYIGPDEEVTRGLVCESLIGSPPGGST